MRTPSEKDVVLSLGAEPGAAMHGTVRDADGKPVAGARIVVRSGGHAYAAVPSLVGAATSGDDGTYRLGPGVIALGAQALVDSDLRTVVQPELEALVAETGETATLEILVDDQMLILSEDDILGVIE